MSKAYKLIYHCKPNIVYILADDMGYGDLSFLNEKAGFQTPNLDQMCKEGLHYTDGHSSSAVCTPSRYSILTGRYNFRSALKTFVLLGFDTPLIEPGRKTIGSYLQEKSYKTACIGKWHLGLKWTHKDDLDKESIEGTALFSGVKIHFKERKACQSLFFYFDLCIRYRAFV